MEAGKDYIGTAVVVAVFNPETKSLLFSQRGSLSKHSASMWEFVTGKVEGVEHPFDAAIRELEEETSITDCYGIDLIDVFFMSYTDGWCWTFYAYLATTKQRAQIKEPDACQSQIWVPIEQEEHRLPSPLVPATNRFLPVVIEELKRSGDIKRGYV